MHLYKQNYEQKTPPFQKKKFWHWFLHGCQAMSPKPLKCILCQILCFPPAQNNWGKTCPLTSRLDLEPKMIKKQMKKNHRIFAISKYQVIINICCCSGIFGIDSDVSKRDGDCYRRIITDEEMVASPNEECSIFRVYPSCLCISKVPILSTHLKFPECKPKSKDQKTSHVMAK